MVAESLVLPLLPAVTSITDMSISSSSLGGLDSHNFEPLRVAISALTSLTIKGWMDAVQSDIDHDKQLMQEDSNCTEFESFWRATAASVPCLGSLRCMYVEWNGYVLLRPLSNVSDDFKAECISFILGLFGHARLRSLVLVRKDPLHDTTLWEQVLSARVWVTPT